MSRNAANLKTARLSVSLDEQTYRKICNIARADDVSVAWVIRRAVSQLVEKRANGSNLPDQILQPRFRAERRK